MYIFNLAFDTEYSLIYNSLYDILLKYYCFSPLLKAREELRPFWKKTWFLVPLILIIIVVVAAVITNSIRSNDVSTNTTVPTSPQRASLTAVQTWTDRGHKPHPKSRVFSVATTNGDYFEKCAPIVTCNASDKYRSYNGSCNNLEYPSWGAALTPFYRLANAEFDDGNYHIYRGNRSPVDHNMLCLIACELFFFLIVIIYYNYHLKTLFLFVFHRKLYVPQATGRKGIAEC